MPKRAVGYIRVSTSEQAREGWSLTAQRRRIKAFAEAKGWKLVRVYADAGISGKNGIKRPEFDKMVREVLADGIDVIIALKLDRLGRSAVALLNMYDRLNAKGVAIVTIDGEDAIDTSTAQGRLFRTILAGVAEFERDLIAQRTKNGLDVARASGKHVGRAPFGWMVKEGRLVKDPAEQKVVTEIRRMHRDGVSYAEISRRLNDAGTPAGSGGEWFPLTVSRVVARGK